ncbi:MAG: DUF5667 domain-containing protein [Chloroflexia bacterium]
MRSGRASWGECSGRPEVQAADVAPLLEIAARMERFPSPEPGPACLVRIRERLGERRHRRPMLRWAWAVLSALLALFLLGGGTVWAAEGSLPGQPLYPVKRWMERVRLRWTQDAVERSALWLQFAERRLDEMRRLCPDRGCPDSLLADLARETETAAAEIEQVPEPHRLQLLERLLELTRRQQLVLEQVLERAPEAARPGLQRALENSRRGHERALRALSKSRATPQRGREGAPPTPKPYRAPAPHGPKTPQGPERKGSPKP